MKVRPSRFLPSRRRAAAALRASAAAVSAAVFSAGASAVRGATWSDGSRTWYYEQVSPSEVSVTGVSPVPAALSVPSTVGGFSVVAIGEGAFADADSVVSLALPSTLESVGSWAFFGCGGLASVTIPASVAEIGDWAFSHCGSLSSFSVAAGNPSFSAVNGVLYSADGSRLVRWPGGKKGACAVAAGTESVAAGAFCGADGVTSVSIPASVSSIGDRAFAHCGSIASFSVDSGNPVFSVAGNGALLGGGGTTLVAFPAASAATYVEVPEGVERIAPSAMAGMKGISSVSFPASVSEIGEGAFLGCPSLVAADSDSLAEPGGSTSVSTVAGEAFLWCLSLAEAPLGARTAVVGPRAFGFCSRLNSVDLGPAAESVGSSVFDGCASLSSVRWRGDAPSGIPDDVFAGTPQTLSVVADSGASGWPYSWPSSGTARRVVVRDTGLSPVYRFWSKGYRAHFYTISEIEKDDIVAHNPNWKLELVAYLANPYAAERTVPVYRFYSKGYRGHFFTTDLEEKRVVMRSNPNWKYEGVAFHVFPVREPGLLPVYRFWSKTYRHHFYTTSEEEKDVVCATNPNWTYECEAFFAAPEGFEAALYARASSPAVAASRSADAPAAVDRDSAAADRDSAAADPESTEPFRDAEFEICGEAPDAADIAASAALAAEAGAEAVPVVVALPAGTRRVQLWRAGTGVLSDGPSRGLPTAEFAIERPLAWHWFRAFGEDGDVSVSFWFRIAGADGVPQEEP